jgi:acyl transferase domain-containing protein
MAVLADSDAGMAEHLDAWLAEGRDPGVATGQAVSGGLAFVFSGNGSQWAGMGRDALARSPSFRAALEHIDLHLAGALGWSVTEMLGDAGLDRALRNTTVAQPLLFAVQVASVVALRAQGVQPIACVGHSAGEVAAAWACGALSLDQACHVIVQRSHAQQPTHGIGRMAALGLGADEAAKLIVELRLDVAIAAINGAAAVTIAGADASLAELEDEAIARGLPFTALDLDYAFHSPAMEPIRTPLLAALDGLRPGTPTFPMHSTVTGQPVGPGELDASYWWRNVRQPVLFRDAVAGLIEAGARIFLEVGPQPVLQSFLRDALKRAGHVGQVLRSLSREPASVDPFAAIAASCHVAGAGLDRATLFDGPATPRGLPAYPWQRQKYAAPRTVEAVELVNLMREHPLLGFRDPASNAVWLSHLSTTLEPWLADHAVDGTAVLPAAAMIDMALAAARAHHPDAGSLEIQDLEISRSLVLDPGATRECRVSVAADGQLELASRPRLADEAMVTHATGRILAGLGDQPTLPLLVGGGEGMDAQTVYAAAAAMHLQYGPQFRRVARVRRIDATHGVVELAPPLLDRVALGYLIDPTLLDGCLQGLLALAAHRPERNQGVVVPWRFGRIRLLRPHGACPTEACLTVRHVGPRAICADIALSDETGAVVAELLDCWFVAMPAGGAALADQSFWTAYVPSARQVAPASADLLGRVLAGAAGVANLPATVLLADAYLAAAAFEARPVRGPLATLAMDWLEEDGLAVREADGWRLAAQSDLPEAAEIWRSLLFDVPRAGAECALLAAIPPALADAALADPAPADSDMGLALSATLREQVLFASPSAASAISALVQGVADLASHWAPGRCMRVALVGAAHAKLLQAVADRLAGCRIPARFVVFTDEADGLAAASIASRGALDAEQPDRFDLVLDLYGLSLPGRAGLTPAMLAGLLAPGGLLLAAEPAASRFAALLFGPALQGDAALRAPDAWCAALREAGCTAAEPVPLDGALWPVALLAATQAANLPATLPAEPGDLVVFAAPDDPLVAALSARQGMLRLLPIEAMADALAAPFAGTLRHLLLFAPGTGDDEAGAETLPEMLAEVSGALLRLPALAAARLWLVARGSPADSTVPAGLTGLRRVAANEVPGLECRTLCLDAALPPAEAAERILSELTDPDGEREAWWHAGGRRWTPARACWTSPARA